MTDDLAEWLAEQFDEDPEAIDRAAAGFEIEPPEEAELIHDD